MTKASDNPFPSILLEDHVDPAAPTSGFHRLFIDTDEKLKMIDHASLVTDFTPGAGGDITTDPAWAAAGDLIVGTGNDAASVLTKGTDGDVLTMVSGAVAWEAPAAGGLPDWDTYMATLAPLHRYKFDEAAGTSSGDFLDTGSVGTLTLADSGSGITYQQTDPFGDASAARFNTGNAVAGSIGSVPTGSNPRTVVMLFKCTIGADTKAIVSYGATSSGQWFMYQLAENDGGNDGDIFDLWDSAFRPLVCAGDGSWHLLALGVVNSRIQSVYLDGKLSSRDCNATINTGTTTKLGVNPDGADLYVADLAVFDTWIGKAKLDKLWAILSAALD